MPPNGSTEPLASLRRALTAAGAVLVVPHRARQTLPLQQLLATHTEPASHCALLRQCRRLVQATVVVCTQRLIPSAVAAHTHPLPVPPQAFKVEHDEGVVHVHTALVHVVPVRQAVPQAPQLVALAARSTQLPLQHRGVVPARQTLPHAPQFWLSLEKSLQTPVQQPGVVPVHTLPQVPQLVALLLRSTQLPAQHRGVVPVVHALAQAPQFWLSLDRSLQAPPQQPGCLPEQAAPQAPQLVALAARSTHREWQQAGVVPVVHRTPQAPQFVVVVMSVQVPLQHPCTGVQTLPQAPQ